MSLTPEEPQSKEKKTFTVYAYKPFWCQIEAADEEEAKKLAVDEGSWESCQEAEGPELNDIYDVVSDEDEETTDEVEIPLEK